MTVMKTGRKVIDPFASKKFESESSEELSSESRVVNNSNYGNCPKCGASCGVAKNHDKLPVFYCEKCRVTTPCRS